jgi:hypothetical protein
MDIIDPLFTFISLCIIPGVHRRSLAATLGTVHQFWVGGGFRLSTVRFIFINLSVLLQMQKPPKSLCWSWHFMCFSAVVSQLYTEFDAVTLFRFEFSDRAVQRDVQSTFIWKDCKYHLVKAYWTVMAAIKCVATVLLRNYAAHFYFVSMSVFFFGGGGGGGHRILYATFHSAFSTIVNSL